MSTNTKPGAGGMYIWEVVTLPDGSKQNTMVRTYEVFGCKHDCGAHDMIKPIVRTGYEQAMATSALLRECGYKHIVINPGSPVVTTQA